MTMTLRRIVLDTNILVSALLFSRGKMAQLRTGWKAGHFIPLVCKETTSELLRVLAYPKFKLEANEIDMLLADILPWAETCALRKTRQIIKGLADIDDAKFIHLACQEKADCLVSGDAHLLSLKGIISGVDILSAAEFMATIDGQN